MGILSQIPCNFYRDEFAVDCTHHKIIPLFQQLIMLLVTGLVTGLSDPTLLPQSIHARFTHDIQITGEFRVVLKLDHRRLLVASLLHGLLL